jgi:DNA helicase-2/ATP-dependent DNA helicase PcrA
MAILVRASFQMRAFEERFVMLQIPYTVVGGPRFFERAEIRDAHAYLRQVQSPDDDLAFERIVNVPKRGIGDASVTRLAAWAQVEGVPFSVAIDRAEDAGLSGRALKGAEQLAKTLGELRPLVDTINPADFVQLVADRTGYLAELVAEHTHEADGRIENLAELATQAGDFDDVMGFLETVALVADSDELESDGTKVSLMTLHTAKGLEYPAVFVVGLEEGIFPHFRALSEPIELEEERRLFYVGITRARQHLAISHAWSRTTWGRTQPAMPSRFVTEVPSHLVEDVGLGSPRRGTGYDSVSGDDHLAGAIFTPAVSLAAKAGAAKSKGRGSTGAEDLGLVAGDEVVHEHWGRGVVISAKGEGSRAQATVDFDSVGKKNLLLSATPLRRA